MPPSPSFVVPTTVAFALAANSALNVPVVAVSAAIHAAPQRLPVTPRPSAPLVRGCKAVPTSKRIPFAELPNFISAKPPTLSAAQIGSLNHLFLQKIDLTRPCHRQDLQQQAQQLAKLGLFDESALAVLDIEAAESFFASEIGKTILANPSAVYREIPFILAITPSELTEPVQADSSADKPLFRGIIDVLIIQDDQATIVVLLMQRLQARILLGISALAGDIDQ